MLTTIAAPARAPTLAPWRFGLRFWSIAPIHRAAMSPGERIGDGARRRRVVADSCPVVYAAGNRERVPLNPSGSGVGQLCPQIGDHA